VALLCAGCEDPVDAGGMLADAGPDDDPLVVADTAQPGSLDDLHRRIIVRSCAGQPGLCHAGQFEPNLATPALMYENLVNRPGLEHERQLRVSPGDPGDSLFVDKLRNRNVDTQMPLGADPLDEAEIAELEAWIADGALRRPGADPAPVLNEPPFTPEIAVTDVAGDRVTDVSVGQTITLRQSVKDFETEDAAIPAAIFALQLPDGSQVIFDPGAMDPQLAFGVYDPAAPMGTGDLLNWGYEWTVPPTVDLLDTAGGVIQDVPTSGMSFLVIGLYIDQFGADGMAAFVFVPDALRVL
jgi:hypothetical protein